MASDHEAAGGRSRPWRRWVPLAVIAAVVMFGLIQLIPYRTRNPPVKQEPPWDSAQTRTLAVAACYDCHSNQTRSRWYEHVAPIAWWTNHHVQQGRAALNFSEYDPNDHRSGRDVARKVQEGSMPPGYYTWFGLHSDARLSAADRAALVAGLQATYGAGAGRDEGRGGGGGKGGDGG
jgi:hypothetical protein